jgi:aryl-alcohol dehydrogenase-like predicted oxidoreductase
MDNPSKRPDATASAAVDRTEMTRLGLGAVQFGLDYGIANRRGKTALDEVRGILALAAEQGLRMVDTAPAYGDSEIVLGQTLPRDHRFQIVTKTPAFDHEIITADDARRLRQSFKESLTRMGQESVYGLLVHHVGDLLAPGGERLWEAMTALKNAGKVKAVGVSVYTGGKIDAILERFAVDLIQLPVNLFDQRLVHGGHLKELKKRGIEIHARSVLLQGLLLMAPEDIPQHLAAARPKVSALRRETKRAGISPQQAALGFVKSIADIDRILIGVENVAQLRDNIAAFAAGADLPFDRFAVTDEQILNPSLWNTTRQN